MKVKVISRAQLPTRMPIQLTVICYLMLDRFKAHPAIWGVAGTILTLLWVIALLSIYNQEPVEVNLTSIGEFCKKEVKG